MDGTRGTHCTNQSFQNVITPTYQMKAGQAESVNKLHQDTQTYLFFEVNFHPKQQRTVINFFYQLHLIWNNIK